MQTCVFRWKYRFLWTAALTGQKQGSEVSRAETGRERTDREETANKQEEIFALLLSKAFT
jgi:hypothetical protein